MLIKNAWKNTTPVCAECQEEMILNATATQCFYKCPKCGKNFSTNYFEKILYTISELDAKRQFSGDLGSLEGEEFTISRKIKCEIIEENEDMTKWKVSIRVLE